MSLVVMREIAEPVERYTHTFRSVSPRIYFVLRGNNTGEATVDTWISRGQPNKKASTHTDVVLLDQFCRE